MKTYKIIFEGKTVGLLLKKDNTTKIELSEIIVIDRDMEIEVEGLSSLFLHELSNFCFSYVEINEKDICSLYALLLNEVELAEGISFENDSIFMEFHPFVLKSKEELKEIATQYNCTYSNNAFYTNEE